MNEEELPIQINNPVNSFPGFLGRNESEEMKNGSILQVNRNARIPKRANHGKRPCSSVMRRLKKKMYFSKIKESIVPEYDAKKKFNI